ncbi:NAD+ synthase [Neochlamydia sp. EPS4]|uniref:NAD+ synthase n=1 Tax=Neochlamydia sp. EPS4 TaxID=1478175 RepID=UPI0005D12E13|nr:NAD+ synthase [Neochlamydia sp. EPS4]
MKILAAQINPTIGALKENTDKILQAIAHGKKLAADLILFPELALTGYPPQDLLLLPHFMEQVLFQLDKIREACIDIIAIVGLPRPNPDRREKGLFNSAAIIQNQKIVGFQDKFLLPTYDVFDERRYFEPATSIKTWNLKGKRVGITVCEDIWQHSALIAETSYHKNPVEELLPFKPELLLNLSASPFSLSKFATRMKVCSEAARALRCPLIFCNQVGANDSLIFDGYSQHLNAKGELVHLAKGFEEDWLLIDLNASSPLIYPQKIATEELYKALILGVKDYFHKSGFQKACLGLSGGIDSAVVACIAVKALGAKNVMGVSMPSRYSSPGSKEDAQILAQNLGIDYRQICIEKAFQSYLELLEPQFRTLPIDHTEENLQARVRGMILMALSNKFGHMVLNTGNKSELAMGYSTLYGDMCGALAVLGDVLKRDVYALAHWINRHQVIIPQSTLDKPPSAELRPNQTDQDSLPPYGTIDHILQAYVEEGQSSERIAKNFDYPVKLVEELIRKIHQNEYKRRQSPPALRISEKAFLTGRCFPIVERWIN